MNYHDTVPTTEGYYWSEPEIVELYAAKCVCNSEVITPEQLASKLPLIGPLPATQEEAIALACEVAFARISQAGRKAFERDRMLFDPGPLSNAMRQFLDGERSLSLLREMERVTGELGAKQ